MKEITRILGLLIFFALVAISPLSAEEADKYPSRPVTLTIAFSPGGSTDLTCRAISHVASKYFNQPIVCMCKPGGGGLVALQYLASSRRDGYTLHLGRPGEMSVAPFIEKMPFVMEKDFIPVAQVSLDLYFISVPAKAPWKTIEELIEAARRDPGNISYGVASATSIARLTMEKFCYEAKIKLTCVPFKGASPAVIAVLGGHVPVLISTISEALPHIQRGDLRVLVSCGEERIKEFPDVPTTKEKGLNVNISAFSSVFAPKGTPPGIVRKFEDLLKKVANDEDFVKTMNRMGFVVKYMSANDFAKSWSQQLKWVEGLVQEIGLANK